MKKLTQYFTSSYAELQKVIWPSRGQATRLTIIVIIGAMGVGIYLTALGYGFQSILQRLLFRG